MSAPKRVKRLEKGENRTLNLMTLARDERKLHHLANNTQYNFGAQLAHRMMASENTDYAPVLISEKVRDVVAAVPESCDTLDLRPHLKVLFSLALSYF
jgi:hypothetical protein